MAKFSDQFLKDMALGTTNRKVLDKLSKLPDSRLPFYVSCNDLADPKTLDALSHHEDPEILWNVAEHKNTPIQTLHRLRKHSHPGVSGAAQRNLANRGERYTESQADGLITRVLCG